MKLELGLETNAELALETQELDLSGSDEKQAVDNLQGRLNILTSTLDQVTQAKMVSRPQVAELVEECDMPLNEDTPLNSFTEEPSATNLTITIESILSTIRSTVSNIFKKLMEFLRRVFAYLKSLLDRLLPYSKNYNKVKKYFSALFKADQDLSDAAQKAGGDNEPTFTPEEEQEKADLAKKADQLVAEWDNRWNGLREAILKNDTYFTTLQAVTVDTEHTLEIITKKMELLMSIMKENARLSSVIVEDTKDGAFTVDYMVKKFEAVADPIDAVPYTSAVQMFDQKFNASKSDNPLGECAKAIKVEYTTLTSAKPNPVIDLKDAAKMYHTRMSVHGTHITDTLLQVNSLLEKVANCQHQLDLLAKFASDEMVTDKAGQIEKAVQKASMTVSVGVNAMQSILSTTSMVTINMYATVKSCCDWLLVDYRLKLLDINAAVRMDPVKYKSLQDAVNAIIAELNKATSLIG